MKLTLKELPVFRGKNILLAAVDKGREITGLNLPALDLAMIGLTDMVMKIVDRDTVSQELKELAYLVDRLEEWADEINRRE